MKVTDVRMKRATGTDFAVEVAVDIDGETVIRRDGTGTSLESALAHAFSSVGAAVAVRLQDKVSVAYSVSLAR